MTNDTTTTSKKISRTRLALLLLAALALLGISSCGSDSDGASDETTTTAAATDDTEPTDEPKVVAVIKLPTTTTTPDATTTTAAKETTTTAPMVPEVVSIEMATAVEPGGEPIDPTTTFSTDNTTIYASVLLKSVPEGTVISGAYEFEGKELTSAEETSKAAHDEVYATFELQSGGTFEAGEYTITVSLDGKAGPSATFTVTA